MPLAHSIGVLHADLCLTLQTLNGRDEIVDGGLCVAVILRSQDDHIPGLADRDGTLAFGNINTNCVHKAFSFEWYCNGLSRLLSLPIQSTGCFHTNARFNLRKTNAANEEPVG